MPCARAGLEAPISISVPRALRSPSPVALGALCRRVLRRVLLGGTAGAVLCGEFGDAGGSSWCHCPCSIPTESFCGVRGPGGSGVLGGGPHLCQAGGTPGVGGVGGGWESGNYCRWDEVCNVRASLWPCQAARPGWGRGRLPPAAEPPARCGARGPVPPVGCSGREWRGAAGREKWDGAGPWPPLWPARYPPQVDGRSAGLGPSLQP